MFLVAAGGLDFFASRFEDFIYVVSEHALWHEQHVSDVMHIQHIDSQQRQVDV